jgi:hypothetical protein
MKSTLHALSAGERPLPWKVERPAEVIVHNSPQSLTGYPWAFLSMCTKRDMVPVANICAGSVGGRLPKQAVYWRFNYSSFAKEPFSNFQRTKIIYHKEATLSTAVKKFSNIC